MKHSLKATSINS